MNYEELKNIITSYETSDVYKVSLSIISDTRKKALSVLDEQDVFVRKNWSKTFKIDEVIQHIYEFFKVFSPDLADRFLNVIKSVDENGDPYIEFKPKTSKYDYGFVDINKATIYFDNSPLDFFVVCHEVLHFMSLNNFTNSESKDKAIYQLSTREVFGETVSILGEDLLGRYLTYNDIISTNDLNKVKMLRLKSLKDRCERYLIETEYIDFMNSVYDNKSGNFFGRKNKYLNDPIMYRLMEKEIGKGEILSDILFFGELNFMEHQKYILAFDIVKKIGGREFEAEEFLQLFKLINEPKVSVHDILGRYTTVFDKKIASLL